MSLQIRRGTAAEVASITPDLAEPIYVTDTQALVIGDGTTQGGNTISANLQTLNISNITEDGHSVTQLYDENSTGTIRLANLFNANSLTVGPDGTVVVGNATLGDIKVQGTWIRNTGTGDIYISPQDGVSGIYFPSDEQVDSGSNVTLFNTSGTGNVQVVASNKNWTFNNDGSLDVPGNIDGAEGFTANMTGFRAGLYSGTSGYSFKDDTDTGMFGWGSGNLRFRVDGNNAALVDSTGWQFNDSISVTNTATVATLKFGDGTEMTTAASGGGGSPFYNLTVTNQLTVTGMSISTSSGGGGTVNVDINTAADNYLHFKPYVAFDANIGVAPGQFLYADTIRSNDSTVAGISILSTATFSSNVVVNNTLSVQSLTVGLNTGTNARDFGYGAMPFNANNMKIELPNNGSSLFFAFKNPGGAARNIGFSRQGNIILQQGNIGLGSPNGIQLVSTDGGRAFVGVNTTTNGITYSSRVGANTSTGVFQTVENSSGVNFSTLLDYNGTFTVPRDLSVTTTATVASLSVTNTATANEVVVGADLQAIKSQGYNVIGVDGNWHVGNVLEVGNGSSGYITSTGDNNLILQTSANNGPGGSVVVQYGGGGVALYSGASQEFQTAVFNTTSNTINYGVTVNGPATFTSPTTLAVFTATALTAISGSVGQIAIVSNSAGGGNPNGMMAFWDTTHGRWSYVHDNNAV